MRHRRHEGVGERDVETVEEEVVAVVVRGGDGFGLIETGLDGRGDPGVAAFAGGAVVEDAGAKSAEVPPHQLGKHPFEG